MVQASDIEFSIISNQEMTTHTPPYVSPLSSVATADMIVLLS